MQSLFRALIIISSSAYVLWFFQPYYSTSLYNEDMRMMLDAHGYNGVDLLLQYRAEIGGGFLIAYLISAIGIFIYIKLARTFFAILCISSIITPLFFGMSVQSHIDTTLNNITYMADAIILYMSSFSSLSTKFNAHNNALKLTAIKRRLFS